jgi:hypothetical protein
MTVLRDAPKFCDEPEGYYTTPDGLALDEALRHVARGGFSTQAPVPQPNPIFGVLDEMRAITQRKNSDYANSSDVFRNFRVCEQMGIPAYEGVIVRMSDKFSRILNLIEKSKRGEGAAVSNESLRDTLIDLGNYAAIAVCLLDEGEESA